MSVFVVAAIAFSGAYYYYYHVEKKLYEITFTNKRFADAAVQLIRNEKKEPSPIELQSDNRFVETDIVINCSKHNLNMFSKLFNHCIKSIDEPVLLEAQ